MMKNSETSAFPNVVPLQSDTVASERGLTKLEWMATMVLQGLNANPYFLQQIVEAAEKKVKPAQIHEIAVASAKTLLEELASHQ